MKKILLAALMAASLVGCASVPTEPEEVAAQVKKFDPPPEGKAGLYIYRSGTFGATLKKDIWIDGDCLGESAPRTFFYKQVDAGDRYLSTESEFSTRTKRVTAESGRNYFILQYITPGVFVGGADFFIMDRDKEDRAKKAIAKLPLAKQGHCSSPFPESAAKAIRDYDKPINKVFEH